MKIDNTLIIFIKILSIVIDIITNNIDIMMIYDKI